MKRRLNVDWSKVDWSKSNKELAEELGYTLRSVQGNRRNFAPKEYQPRVRRRVDWSKVDWSENNGALAKQLGYSYEHIVTKRRELASKGQIRKGEIRSRGNIRHNIDWEKVDWSLSSGEISRRLRVSETNVRYHRARLGIANDYRAIDWSNADWSKSNKELAEELGCRYATVSEKRKKLAPKEYQLRVRRRVDWSKVDWSKSNTELAKELRCSVKRLALPRAKHAPHTVDTRLKIDWTGVDWTKSNLKLAAELGCHKDTVGIYRQLHALDVSRANKASILEELGVDWDRPLSDLSREHNLSESYLRALRAKARGREAPKREYPDKYDIDWNSIDWEQPIKQIMEETGASRFTVTIHKGIAHGQS